MKWQRTATAPISKPVLVHAKYRFGTDSNDMPIWSGWSVIMAYQLKAGEWCHFPGYWAGGMNRDPEMKVRRWAECPAPPFVPVIDQKKMLIGRIEAQAQREHARRIAAGIED